MLGDQNKRCPVCQRPISPYADECKAHREKPPKEAVSPSKVLLAVLAREKRSNRKLKRMAERDFDKVYPPVQKSGH